LVNFACEKHRSYCSRTAAQLFAGVLMSDNLAVPMKSAPTGNNVTDARILAQVEKWMALIREIKQERAKN
jgi:hypothetical protein